MLVTVLVYLGLSVVDLWVLPTYGHLPEQQPTGPLTQEFSAFVQSWGEEGVSKLLKLILLVLFFVLLGLFFHTLVDNNVMNWQRYTQMRDAFNDMVEANLDTARKAAAEGRRDEVMAFVDTFHDEMACELKAWNNIKKASLWRLAFPNL